tara:strand:- start:1673 stop:2446 length:774 start_codon:yes stop_codon:yes gene_type:complete
MADQLIKEQAIEIGNATRTVIYQRNVFIKRNLRKQLLETLSLGFDFKAIFQKFYPSEKESTVEPKKASELETFDDLINFFTKTIELGFGGEEATPNEVTEYLLTSDEAISPYDISNGGMFMFKYEPTTKNDLKYYDAIPLIIMIGRTSDGFIGLNLHYLPEKYRIALLKKLFTSVDFSKVDAESDVQSRLNVVSAYKLIKPIYKRYKYDGVSSRLVRIPIENWLMASLLPISKFEGKSRKEVWDDSRKIIFDEERRI